MKNLNCILILIITNGLCNNGAVPALYNDTKVACAAPPGNVIALPGCGKLYYSD